MENNTLYPIHWPRVWRGESSGQPFETFDIEKTNARVGFFFAERYDHAQFYTRAGTPPRAFVLDPGNTLDLQDPYEAIRCPKAKGTIQTLSEAFDEWTCRRSGEDRDVFSYLEAGDLYDYEGTGSAQRWNTLFSIANQAGYDSVRVRDETDGVHGEDAIVWVVFDPKRIHHDFRPTPVEGITLSRRYRP